VTATYRIAEVAERTGFSPPTLRYYETIGLLPPPQRAANGYRVYDEATLDRLGFVTRAKQLGCSLEEITELTRAWETGHCAPVQSRLSAVVGAKIADAEARIAELSALVADLRRSAAALGSHTPDGPCDDRCGCTSTPDEATTPAAVALTTRAAGVGRDEAPVACTLGAGDVADRLDEWHALLAGTDDRRRGVTARVPLDGGLRLEVGPETDVGELARLAASEQECCRFFRFALVVDQRGVALEVHAPPEARPVLDALLGATA
jgi:MerR family transcriptional regulator, copper efflux regulator